METVAKKMQRHMANLVAELERDGYGTPVEIRMLPDDGLIDMRLVIDVEDAE